jgi:hypothetical protein
VAAKVLIRYVLPAAINTLTGKLLVALAAPFDYPLTIVPSVAAPAFQIPLRLMEASLQLTMQPPLIA